MNTLRRLDVAAFFLMCLEISMEFTVARVSDKSPLSKSGMTSKQSPSTLQSSSTHKLNRVKRETNPNDPPKDVICFSNQPLKSDIPCSGSPTFTKLTEEQMQTLLQKPTAGFTTSDKSLSYPPIHTIQSDKVQDLDELLYDISTNQVLDTLLTSANSSLSINNTVLDILKIYESIHKFTQAYSDNIVGAESHEQSLRPSSVGEDLMENIVKIATTVDYIVSFYKTIFNSTNKVSIHESMKAALKYSESVDFEGLQNTFAEIDAILSSASQQVVLAFNHSMAQVTGPNLNIANDVFNNDGEQNYSTTDDLILMVDNNFSSSQANVSAALHQNLTLASVVKILDAKLDQLNQSVEGFKDLISQWREDIGKLASLTSRKERVRRNVIGHSGRSCQNQGSKINNGNYLSLCSSCMQAIDLGENFFPRYLTENICNSQSSSAQGNDDSEEGCLHQPGVNGSKNPAGKCKQNTININVLEREPGRCMQVMLDGKEVTTDYWRLTSYPLNSGCECIVHENSRFAGYVRQ